MTDSHTDTISHRFQLSYHGQRHFHGQQSFIDLTDILMRSYPSLNAPVGNAPPWGGPFQNLVRPQIETESTRQLSCDVVFGLPSADCRGTGICRISARSGGSPTPYLRKQSCQSTVGLLFPIEGGNGVSLVLTTGLLCSKLYKEHLRHGTLKIEEACPLPEDVIERLGLRVAAIQPGTYTIQQSAGFLRIDFNNHLV